MNYFEEVDAWLTELLAGPLGGPQDEETEQDWLSRAKSEIKDKLLESYRNGQKAGLKPPKESGRAETGARAVEAERSKNRFPSAKSGSYYRKPKRQ